MKKLLISAAAIAMGTSFAVAGPTIMADDQMDKIVAGNHVIRRVELRSGRAVPPAAAIDATTAAGSNSGAQGRGRAQDRVVIVGML
ncbi:MAG: hypothetical protein N2B03_05680 [Boseongicola sp.]